jgi:Cu-Zn family superoxide dismutase
MHTAHKFLMVFLFVFSFKVSCGASAQPKPVDTLNENTNKKINKKIIAKCKLEPKNNSAANGEIRFYFEKDDLIAEVKLKDVIAGMHGFHIHEKGDCSAADASSAGGHYNPYHGKHGSMDSSVRHFGDLGNIEVLANGTSFKKIILKDPNFNAKKDWKNLLNKSIILHANPDDLSTDPAGNSGPRISCCVIQ